MNRAGLEGQYSPRTAGQMSLHTNTDLCVDLKTNLRHDRIAKLGKDYSGLLRRDNEYHFTFTETLFTTFCKRNPQVFVCEYFNITRRDDGSFRLNFRPIRLDDGFDVDDYAIGVCNELRKALKGLREEE